MREGRPIPHKYTMCVNVLLLSFKGPQQGNILNVSLWKLAFIEVVSLFCFVLFSLFNLSSRSRKCPPHKVLILDKEGACILSFFFNFSTIRYSRFSGLEVSNFSNGFVQIHQLKWEINARHSEEICFKYMYIFRFSFSEVWIQTSSSNSAKNLHVIKLRLSPTAKIHCSETTCPSDIKHYIPSFSRHVSCTHWQSHKYILTASS